MEDAEFLRQLSRGDDDLGIQVRRAIAAYFEVPPEKILPTDELRRDYKYEVLGQSLQQFVVAHVFQTRGIELPRWFVFRSTEVGNVADLCTEIQRIIDGPAPT